MASFASALFIAFIAYNSQCFAQFTDPSTVVTNLNTIAQTANATVAAANTNRTIVANQVAAAQQSISTCQQTAQQTYSDIVASGATVTCDSAAVTQQVNSYGTDAQACITKVSTEANTQYTNVINQATSVGGQATTLKNSIQYCLAQASGCLSTTLQVILGQATIFISNPATSAALVPNAGYDTTSVQSQLDNCTKCTQLLNSIKAC